MPRYELRDGATIKFWEIELAGAAVSTKYGKVGGSTNLRSKACRDDAAARKEFDKQVREKVTGGFVLVGAAKAAKGGKAATVSVVGAGNTTAKRVATASAGFVLGAAKAAKGGKAATVSADALVSAKPVAKRGKGAPTAASLEPARASREPTAAARTPTRASGEPRDATLERSIVDDPDDDSAFEVYGDWLSSQGDPRGDLVALHKRGLAKQASAHLAKHPALWGELGDAKARRYLKDITWRLGFIDSVAIEIEQDDLDDDEDNEEDSETVAPRLLGKLLDGPGRFLRSLAVHLVEIEDGYDPVIKLLAKRGLPTLRSLRLAGPDDEFANIGLLGKLSAAVPGLETLWMRASAVRLDKLALPKLRELTIVSGSLENTNLRVLGKGTWPSLDRLELWCGEHGGTVYDAGDLAGILAAKGLPKLTHLGIVNYEESYGPPTDLLDALLRSKLLPQLRVLDLSLGVLADEEAELLVASGKLAHLRELVVTGNYLTKAGLKTLAKLGCTITSKTKLEPPTDRLNSIGQRVVDDGRRCGFVENFG